MTDPTITPWPDGWAVVAPVGSVTTDTGLVVALVPDLAPDRPVTVRCTACDWDDTAISCHMPDAIRVHALRHVADTRPQISHWPSWLTPHSNRRKDPR